MIRYTDDAISVCTCSSFCACAELNTAPGGESKHQSGYLLRQRLLTRRTGRGILTWFVTRQGVRDEGNDARQTEYRLLLPEHRIWRDLVGRGFPE